MVSITGMSDQVYINFKIKHAELYINFMDGTGVWALHMSLEIKTYLQDKDFYEFLFGEKMWSGKLTGSVLVLDETKIQERFYVRETAREIWSKLIQYGFKKIQ